VSLFIISAVITLLTQVYSVYLRTFGVARLNRITMWQSFLCIYIWPLILLLALELLVLTVMGLFIFLA
jgi:hypothetical protein